MRLLVTSRIDRLQHPVVTVELQPLDALSAAELLHHCSCGRAAKDDVRVGRIAAACKYNALLLSIIGGLIAKRCTMQVRAQADLIWTRI